MDQQFQHESEQLQTILFLCIEQIPILSKYLDTLRDINMGQYAGHAIYIVCKKINEPGDIHYKYYFRNSWADETTQQEIPEILLVWLATFNIMSTFYFYNVFCDGTKLTGGKKKNTKRLRRNNKKSNRRRKY
jgi:hypothetical protein